MPFVARRMDAVIGQGSHGKKCCPHTITGHHMMTRKNVIGNTRGVVGKGDIGMHNCPHCPYLMAVGNRSYVTYNNKGAHLELHMATTFCGIAYTVCNGPKNIKVA